MPTRDVIFRILGEDAASPAFNRAAASAEGAAARISRAGDRMAVTGRRMTHTLTLPLLAIAGVSVKAATDFNASMTRIQTQAGASAADVRYLSKQVLAMKDVQQGPNELANALYHLKSVGMDNAAAMKALRQASDLAAVGHADLEETTNALAGAWRTGIRGAKDFHQAVATINAIIGAGNMKLEDFNAALGTGILPTAKTFGLTLKDVGSALAVFTDESVPADAAATRLRMSISLLAAPSNAAEKQLRKIGLSGLELGNDMRKPNGLIVAIGDLKQHLDDSGLSATRQAQLLSRAFGGGRSSSAILSLVNNFDVLEKKQDQVTRSLGRYDKAVRTQQATPEAQFRERLAQLQKAGVILGTDLLPAATATANEISHLVDGFNHLTPAQRGFLIDAAKIAIVLGPGLAVVGRLVKTFTSLGFAAKSAALFMTAPYRNAAVSAEAAALRTEYANTQMRADEALTAAAIARAKAQEAAAAEEAAVRIALAAERSGVAMSGLATQAGLDAIEFNAAMQAEATAAQKMAVETAAAAEAAQIKLAGAMAGTTRSAYGLQSAITGLGIGLTVGTFTRGASTSTKLISDLGAAGAGAAIGWSMGGPWGAAIGGLTAGLSSLATQFLHLGGHASQASQIAQQSLENQDAAAQDLLGTLKAVNGAYAKQTRITVANLLQTTPIRKGGPDLLQAASQLGVKPADLTGAVLGNERLLDKVHAQILRFAGTAKDALVEQVLGAFDSVTIGGGKAERAFERYNAAVGHVIVPQKLLEQGAKGLAKELRGTGTALDSVTAYGIRNTEVVRANLGYIDKSVLAELRHGKSVKQVAADYEAQINTLGDTLHQLGFNDKAVQHLIATYSHVPKKVITYLEKHGVTPGDIQVIIDKYHQVPRHIRTDIDVVYNQIITGHAPRQAGGSGVSTPGLIGAAHAAGGSVRDGYFTVGEEGGPHGWELGYKKGGQLRFWSNADSRAMTGWNRVPGYATGTAAPVKAGSRRHTHRIVIDANTIRQLARALDGRVQEIVLAELDFAAGEP